MVGALARKRKLTCPGVHVWDQFTVLLINSLYFCLLGCRRHGQAASLLSLVNSEVGRHFSENCFAPPMHYYLLLKVTVSFPHYHHHIGWTSKLHWCTWHHACIFSCAYLHYLPDCVFVNCDKMVTFKDEITLNGPSWGCIANFVYTLGVMCSSRSVLPQEFQKLVH